jgi:hypothetical protein
MTTVQGDQALAKQQKMLKKFENSSTKTVAEQYMSSQTLLGSVMEFARRSLQKIWTCATLPRSLFPRILTNDQKQQRVNICLGLWDKANENPTFISRIIMGDESWIYGYHPETKQQSSRWKSPQSPRAKKTQQVQSSTKSMFIVFFRCEADCSSWICSS